jgi:hypothetical protein
MTIAIFDRMTAMLVLEHLYDLSATVNEAARLFSAQDDPPDAGESLYPGYFSPARSMRSWITDGAIGSLVGRAVAMPKVLQ